MSAATQSPSEAAVSPIVPSPRSALVTTPAGSFRVVGRVPSAAWLLCGRDVAVVS